MAIKLKAPFPYFGGKSRVAPLVWERFGDVPNYVEPFAGSLAVLLGRPHEPKNETVNDKDAYLSNFWRAVHADPAKVAKYADWPVNEADLHARHKWLVKQTKFRDRMLSDPDYYDAKIAGWWAWGVSQWIGSGWCSRPDWTGRGNVGRASRGIHAKIPLLGNGGRGVHRSTLAEKRPQLKRGGNGVHRNLPQQIPDISGAGGAAGRGIHASGQTNGTVYEWFECLASRLRRVRVCCGDWTRILGASPTTKIGVTGVFLDPPYDLRIVSNRKSGRDGSAPSDALYSHHDHDVSAAVREWALANGDNSSLRIALCGYEGEHSMPDAWECVPWKANGGYGNQSGETKGRKNATRERIWFSPHCLKTPLFSSLFDEQQEEQ